MTDQPTCGCRWVTVSDGGDGMDGEFVVCEEHGVAIDLDDVIRNGWPEMPADAWGGAAVSGD